MASLDQSRYTGTRLEEGVDAVAGADAIVVPGLAGGGHDSGVGLAVDRRELSQRIEFGGELIGGGVGLHPRLASRRKNQDLRSPDGLRAGQAISVSHKEIHCRGRGFDILRSTGSLLVLQEFDLLFG